MIRLIHAPLLVVLAACTTETTTIATTITASVTPEQAEACTTAAAEARNVPKQQVQAVSAAATPTGPVVTLDVGGSTGTCYLDELGRVTSITF
jgi:hypothetical protein